MFITSMAFAEALNVLLPLANFIVLLNDLPPVASCLIFTIAVVPVTAFAIVLSVISPSATTVNIEPSDAFAELLMSPFVVPKSTTVSLYVFSIVVAASIEPLVCIPLLLMLAHSVFRSLLLLTSLPMAPPCPNLICLPFTAPILVSSACFKKHIWSFAVLLCA